MPFGSYDTGWYNRWQGSLAAVAAVCRYSYTINADNVYVSAYTETWWRYWNSASTAYDAFGQVAIDYPLGQGVTSASVQVRPNDRNGTGANGGNTGSVGWTFKRGTSAYTVYVRCRAYNTAMPTDTGWHTATEITIPAIPQPHAPTNCTHVRNSDAQNTLTWANNPTTSSPYGGLFIERKVNGGAWQSIVGDWQTAAGAGFNGATTSWVDTGCLPDSTYQYRVRAEWCGMLSGYSNESATTYNTPAATNTPEAMRNADNTVTVIFENNARTETATELQRSSGIDTDGRPIWGNEVTTTVTLPDQTEITDSPGGGAFFYRVRNARGDLTSAWSAYSNQVTTVLPPQQPTLISPANDTYILYDQPVTISWQHNPADGNAQTAAQIKYSVDGIVWTHSELEGQDTTYTFAAGSFSLGDNVLWAVRTKAADPDYGPYCNPISFRIIAAPVITITSPLQTVDRLPIEVAFTYSDMPGEELSKAVIRILEQDVLVASTTTQELSASLSSPDFKNATSYRIELSAQSTSGAVVGTSLEFSIDFEEPACPQGTVTVHETTASVSLYSAAGEDVDALETEAISIYRQNACGRIVTLLDKAPSGVSITDAYPPLDQKIIYIFEAISAVGTRAVYKSSPVVISSFGRAWFNLGERFNEVVALALNVQHSESPEQHSEIFQTAGSLYPRVYYGQPKRESGSISATALREESLWCGSDVEKLVAGSMKDADKLLAHSGMVVLRLPYKEVMAANITVSKSVALWQGMADISVTWERVRADGLVI